MGDVEQRVRGEGERQDRQRLARIADERGRGHHQEPDGQGDVQPDPRLRLAFTAKPM